MEAGPGALMVRHLGGSTGYLPVVRRVEAKFRKHATGRVSARVGVSQEEVDRWKAELAARGRVSAQVPVEVVDAADTVVMAASVEWFITRG